MRRGLVGDEVEALAGGRPGGFDLGGVADQGDARAGSPSRRRGARPCERLGRVGGQPVDVADIEPAPGARLVDLDDDADAVVHRHRQRLGAAHPAEPGRERDRPAQGAAEMLAGRLGERLVGALQDALRPDVDPRARRSSGRTSSGPSRSSSRKTSQVAHLPTRFELAMRTRGAHGCVRTTPTGLPDWMSSVSSPSSRRSSRTMASNASQRTGGSTGPAVDDEVVGVLGDLRIEVVHEHPERGFLLPAAAAELAPAWRADGAGADGAHDLGHRGVRLAP